MNFMTICQAVPPKMIFPLNIVGLMTYGKTESNAYKRTRCIGAGGLKNTNPVGNKTLPRSQVGKQSHVTRI